jgi:centromere protein I
MFGRSGSRDCGYHASARRRADSVRLELCQNFGNDPPLVGLLRVYRNFYPEISVGSALSGRKTSLSVRVFARMNQANKNSESTLSGASDSSSFNKLLLKCIRDLAPKGLRFLVML